MTVAEKLRVGSADRVALSGNRVRLPFMRKRPGGTIQICDGSGHVIFAPTLFLQDLSGALATPSLYQYAQQFVDVFRLLALWNGGVGLPWWLIGEDFLDRWHIECISVRKVSRRVFKSRLKLLLRFIRWAQDTGWTCDQIGVETSDRKFPISVSYNGTEVWHRLLSGKVTKRKTKLPTNDVLDLVEAKAAQVVLKVEIRRRNHHLLTLCRILTLRRSEVVNIPSSAIPPTAVLKRLRSAGGTPMMKITIMRAKGAGERSVDFPFSILESLRDFIDVDRPKLLGLSGNDAGFLFCAYNRGGRALSSQAVTNFYKNAANLASDENSNPEISSVEIREAHPHHLRHRAVTDIVSGFMREGMSADHAMLSAMDKAAVSSIDMARHYTHLAEADIERETPEWKRAEEDIERRSQARVSQLQLDRFARGHRR